MPEFENIGIVGLGLLGGSIGLAVKQKKLAKHILGWTRTPETIVKAENKGIIDKTFTSFQEFIGDTDFLILCAPVFSNNKYIEDIVRLKPELLFTDIGSTKSAIVKCVDAFFVKPHNFVGSHPMAGSENKGIDFADSKMLENKIVILTPGEKSSPFAIAQIKNFWKSLGCKTAIMNADKHDEILAYTSHLPHSIVFALCKTLKKEIDKEEFFLSVGSGLMDTTRIGSSDPQVWTEIFISNRSNILSAIERIKAEIDEFTGILENKDADLLKKYLEDAKNIRKIIEKHGQKKDS